MAPSVVGCTNLSGASKAEVYRTWCTPLGRSLEPLISPIQKKIKQIKQKPTQEPSFVSTHLSLQVLPWGPFLSALLQVYQASKMQEDPDVEQAAMCDNCFHQQHSHWLQVSQVSCSYHWAGVFIFFLSVLRPPSVWRNSEEVSQWVSELLWPRRGRGLTA